MVNMYESSDRYRNPEVLPAPEHETGRTSEDPLLIFLGPSASSALRLARRAGGRIPIEGRWPLGGRSRDTHKGFQLPSPIRGNTSPQTCRLRERLTTLKPYCDVEMTKARDVDLQSRGGRT